MAYHSLSSLAQTIDEIQIQDQNPFSVPGYQEIKSIHDHTTSLLPFFENSPEDVISWERRLSEVANKAKDIIQFFILEKNGSDCGSMRSGVGRWSTFKLKQRLKKVAEEMNSIVGEMKRMSGLTIEDPPLSDQSAAAAANSSSTFDQNDMFFDFGNHLMRIKDWLCGDGYQRLAIFGSGGIGKTALARCVYNDPLIMNHFDIRIWLSVSLDYSLTDILRSLQLSLDLPREEISPGNIGSRVGQTLCGKRYLIVMDDVWSMEVWYHIMGMLPDNCNGSRMMMTTRQLDVVVKFCHYDHPHRSNHRMNLIDDDQSWCLLQNKVFGEQGCPHEFELIGRKIASGCGGLPLSIVIMADLLSSIPMTLQSWEAISEDVLSAISTKDGQLEKMVSSSFMDLPHHLRQCLLYMGAFPKNYELRVSELIKLWVAEGFVEPNVSKTFEEVAEEYVEDLVNRNLVIVVRRNEGKIDRYSLQNVVRDFCIRRIQERKFLLPVMDYLPNTTLRRYFLPKILKNQRRVILNSYDLHLGETIHNSPMRTIICIQQGEHLSMGSVLNFPLLRILHVVNKSDNLGWDDKVFELIHLRYLAANISSLCIPAAISKLQNLQTLIIYRHGVRLPKEIWRLTKLRHLIAFSFHPSLHLQPPISPLQSLQTLSLVFNFRCSEMILKIIPNLKKLGICYSKDTFDQDYYLNNLPNLHQLETLKLVGHNDFFARDLNHVFPLTLKKLTLSGCRLPWKDMKILGSLPNLEVLKLRNFAFQGNQWRTTRGGFCCLKYLLIDESDLMDWSFKSYDTFHTLKFLGLIRCPYLTSMPLQFGYIPTLQALGVDGGNQYLVELGKEIQEEKQKEGNNSFELIVKHL